MRELKIGTLKNECISEYINAHDNIWEELLDDYKRYGMKQVSSFLLGNKVYIYLEYDEIWLEHVNNLDSDRRWQEYMKTLTIEEEQKCEPEEVYHYPIGE